MLMGLHDQAIKQGTLFDTVNHRFGRCTLRLASEGMRQKAWVSKADKRTPAYTTRRSDVPVVRA